MKMHEIVERLMDSISEEPITFNKICRSSKLHPRTVKRYLELIQIIQQQNKVTVERKGFRIYIRK